MRQHLDPGTVKLTIRQRLELALVGQTFFAMEKPPGYSDYTPMYVVKCKRHGLTKVSPHGFYDMVGCPECDDEIHSQLVRRMAQNANST